MDTEKQTKIEEELAHIKKTPGTTFILGLALILISAIITFLVVPFATGIMRNTFIGIFIFVVIIFVYALFININFEKNRAIPEEAEEARSKYTKKSIVIMVVSMIIAAAILAASFFMKPVEKSDSDYSSDDYYQYSDNDDSDYNSYSDFSNKYGNSSTQCAHPGCTSPIASSGDTNCCITHSNRCLNCRCYIDGDATYCMSCIESALS